MTEEDQVIAVLKGDDFEKCKDAVIDIMYDEYPYQYIDKHSQTAKEVKDAAIEKLEDYIEELRATQVKIRET